MNKTLIALFFLVLMQVTSALGQRKSHKSKNTQKSVLETLCCEFLNDHVLPPYLRQIYQKDATRLALRILNEEQALKDKTVRVPEELKQQLYNALVSIRISDLPVVDTISRICYVHTSPYPSTDFLVLLVEHNAPWLAPVIARQDTTGSPSINHLIRQFNLVMTRLIDIDSVYCGLILQTQEPLNIRALADKFITEEGVHSVEEIQPWAEGSNITAKITESSYEITYSLYIPDKKQYHYWRFKAFGCGNGVEYLGESGCPLPADFKPSYLAKKYPDVLKKN